MRSSAAARWDRLDVPRTDPRIRPSPGSIEWPTNGSVLPIGADLRSLPRSAVTDLIRRACGGKKTDNGSPGVLPIGRSLWNQLPRPNAPPGLAPLAYGARGNTNERTDPPIAADFTLPLPGIPPQIGRPGIRSAERSGNRNQLSRSPVIEPTTPAGGGTAVGPLVL
jgi:hypothetical protein